MTLPFTHPWILLPAALLALAALGLGLRAQFRPGLGVQVVGQRPGWQGLGMALMLAGLGLGLAEPRWGLPTYPRLTVHVVLDASRSMTVPDAGGRTRWEAAVASLDRLWSSPRPGLRWSLDLLTGDDVPMEPPGEDRTLLRECLRAVTPGDVGSPGTSLGRGLAQVAAQADREGPEVVLLLSDGEETWETPEAALARATEALRKAHLPLFALAFGDGKPHAVPPTASASVPSAQPPAAPGPPPEPLVSTAHPGMLARLAQGTGGRLFPDADTAAAALEALAAGKLPMPVRRSIQPTHPELGAWIALAGFLLWLAFAGRPMARWRPLLLLLLALAAPSLRAGAPLHPWAPQSVKAWLAQRALEAGDLSAAQRWCPSDGDPAHLLLAAQIALTSLEPEAALRALEPLLGQGAPRPLPAWRAPALLLAARAQVALRHPDAAQSLLERLILEEPGQPEAVHDLQTLEQDVNPPPPDPRNPPPPPPPRPSLGAQQDELEGLRQRLPVPPKAPAGVKDQ